MPGQSFRKDYRCDRRALILVSRGRKGGPWFVLGYFQVDRLARSGVSAVGGLCSTQGAAWLAWAMVVAMISGRRSGL